MSGIGPRYFTMDAIPGAIRVDKVTVRATQEVCAWAGIYPLESSGLLHLAGRFARVTTPVAVPKILIASRRVSFFCVVMFLSLSI